MTTYAARGATEQPECYGAPPPRVRGITGGTAIFSPSQAPSAHIATTKNAEAARYQASGSIIRNSSAREVDRTRDRGVAALKITGLPWSAGGCPRPPPRTRRPLRAAGSSASGFQPAMISISKFKLRHYLARRQIAPASHLLFRRGRRPRARPPGRGSP